MARPSMLVKVGETEFKALLNRDETIADVKEHLSPWLDLLRDLSNYGSNLIPRCFSSSARELKDAVVLGTLLRQIVTMLDGVEVLLSNGAPYTAQLQLRALLEASIYIEWILESDGDKKVPIIMFATCGESVCGLVERNPDQQNQTSSSQ